MKNLSKKLVMSIVAVTLVVAALGASTFAWFTLSNRAEIGTFEAEVTAGEGIEISLDQENWFSVLTTSMIEDWITQNGDFKLNAVTSSDNSSFTKLNGTNDAFVPVKSTLTATGVNDIAEYIEFNLYFRSTNVTEIRLSELTFGGASKNFTVDVPTLKLSESNVKNQNDVLEVYALDAARVSFTNSVHELVYQAADSGSNTVSSQTPTVYGQYDYFLKKNDEVLFGFDPEASPAEELMLDAATTVGASDVVVTLVGGLGSTNIKVWIEGWDQEAYNSILSAQLTISIKFEGIEQ
ncbi:MAG: hypothetical protein RBQ95_04640 [Paracholeplasma sp.]|nr:hypothetical protein [Paracholeplasma sp.]MDY3196127.1 hypothetical protein [Paracholeplasma sp.]